MADGDRDKEAYQGEEGVDLMSEGGQGEGAQEIGGITPLTDGGHEEEVIPEGILLLNEGEREREASQEGAHLTTVDDQEEEVYLETAGRNQSNDLDQGYEVYRESAGDQELEVFLGSGEALLLIDGEER